MKITLYLALVLSLNVVFAQELKFNFGPSINNSGWLFFNRSLKQGYIIESRDEFSLTPVDEYLKPGITTTVKAEVPDQGKFYLEETFAINDKNYVIYSIIDNKKSQVTVYSQELSASMTLLGSPIRITTFNEAKTSTGVIVVGKGLIRSTGITVGISASQRQIVILKEREKGIEAIGFSPEKGQTWSSTFPLNNEFSYKLKSVRVTENGNVYILGTYYEWRMGEYTKKDPFLIAYSPSTKAQKIQTMDSGEKFDDMGFALELLDDETVIMAGIFFQKKKGHYQVYKINSSTLAPEKFATAPLAEAYSNLTSEKAYDPEYFNVKGITQLKNGSIVFSIEGGLVSSGSYTSTVYSSSAYVVSLSSGGTEQWNTTIQKFQACPLNGSLAGHFLFSKGNKVYLMYNDHPDNFDQLPTDKQKEFILKKNFYVCTAEINESGKSRKLKLVTTNKSQVSSFDPDYVQKIERGLYHFQFIRDKARQFATLSVAD